MTPRRAAVLGHPIAHSLSPLLHRAAYRVLGLDWEYTAIDVEAGALAGFMAGLGPEWVGLSLTMPLKREVLDLVDEVDAVTQVVGAANTVVFSRDGHRTGANTDVSGFEAALREGSGAVQPEVTILGGGATAASALAALARLGVANAQVFVRNAAAADELAGVAERAGIGLTCSPWRDAVQGLVAGLVVSTVPAGATDELVRSVPTLPGTLFEVVYDPWPTALAAQWTVRGGEVVSGHDLLVHQAAAQVRLMTGFAVEVSVLREALATA